MVYVKSEVVLQAIALNREALVNGSVASAEAVAAERPAKRSAEVIGQENVPAKRRITTWI